MNRLIRRTKGRVSLTNVALLLVTSSLVAQLLGVLRTKLVNANFSAFGANSTDSYFAAFNIPDFFFYAIAAGALGVAFIPILTEHLTKNDRKGALELTSSLLNLFAAVMAIAGVVIFVFARPLIHVIVAPGMSPHELHNTVMIMRLVAFDPLLFTISGILTSLQQSIGRFFFYAMGPIFYNLSIILSIFIFRNNIGIIGLGIGALVGSIVQLLIVASGLIGINYEYHFHITWRRKDFQTVLRNFPARSLSLGVNQIESIAETHFATGLGVGNISFYSNAYILQTAPTLLIGSAISTAVFPRFSSRIAQHRPDLFRKDFLRMLRIMVWIISPKTVISYFARGYLARLIFAKDSSEIAIVFGFMAGAIFFNTLYTLISRWFYAQKDTKTPLYIAVLTIIINVILAYKLSRPDAYGVAGLAIAQSLVAALEVGILFAIMLLRDHRLFDKQFWSGITKIISATGFTIVAAYIMISLFPLEVADHGILTLGTKLAIISIVTFAVHIAISALFGLDEPKPFINRIKRIVLKPIPVSY
jgi:putative peptidoglycan lipid II flippase